MSRWVSDLKVRVFLHRLKVFFDLVLDFWELCSNVSFSFNTSLSHVWHVFAWRLENQVDSFFNVLIIAINDLSNGWDGRKFEVEARIFSQNICQSFNECIHPRRTINFDQFLNSFNSCDSNGWGSVFQVVSYHWLKFLLE